MNFRNFQKVLSFEKISEILEIFSNFQEFLGIFSSFPYSNINYFAFLINASNVNQFKNHSKLEISKKK
jgi:hypothetical protein